MMQEHSQPSGVRRLFNHLANRLFNPHQDIRDVASQRRARLTAILSVVLAFTTGLGMIFSNNAEDDNTAIILLGGLTVSSIIGYLISRSRRYVWGSVILVTSLSTAGFSLVILGSNNPMSAFLTTIPLAFVISSAILSVWGTVILVTGSVVGIMLLPVFYPPFGVNLVGTTLATLVPLGILLISAQIFRNNLEQARLNEVQTINQELRELGASLEQRVADATRNLELAARVGRRVSLVREVDTMLKEAVEIIRERFDLYYSQVYLTDPIGRSLVLRAGTGEVGQTLLSRGHRLQISMGSLNGIAATERRSVIVVDTETNSLHRVNPMLPETRSEMVVPMMVGDRVVGVLDMQSSQAGALNEENLTAFETLAGQMAISVVNAELFAETEAAQTAIQEQAQFQTGVGWNKFMDAIERKERLAYSYEQEVIRPLDEALPETETEDSLVTPIRFTGVELGKMHFQRDEPWAVDDYATTSAVARQMAQQIENLRLLAQAEQYQNEAQETLQRLTREGWEEFQNQAISEEGFVYADHVVKPLDESSEHFDGAIKYEISVRDEPIGEIKIAGEEALSEADAEMVAYINEQLAAHLENLRLSTQTEQALAVTEDQANRLAILNTLSEELATSQSFVDIFKIAGQYLPQIVMADWVSSTRLHESGGYLDIFPLHGREGILPRGTQVSPVQTSMGEAIQTRRPVNINNLRIDTHKDSKTLFEQGLKSILVVPLIGSQSPFGTLNFGSTQINSFDERDQDIALQAAVQIASVLENRSLLEQTQSVLAQTEVLYAGSEQVVRAGNIHEVLAALVESTALKQLNRVSLNIFDHPWDPENQPEGITMVAATLQGNEESTVPEGTYYRLDEYPLAKFLAQNEPILISDLNEDPRVDENSRQYFTQILKVKGVVGLPLVIAGRSIGGIVALADQVVKLQPSEIRQMISLSDQAATVIQNMRLFEQAQRRAQREQALRQITAAVRGSTDPNTIMRTAVEELGNALGRKTSIRMSISPSTDAEKLAS